MTAVVERKVEEQKTLTEKAKIQAEQNARDLANAFRL
jgi:hypothetical protein